MISSCICVLFCNLFSFLMKFPFLSREISVECTQNHVRVPPGARVMNIFVKLKWVITMVEKSPKNYIEWFSHCIKPLDFGWHYAGIRIIHCIHAIHWIWASKKTAFGLSASEMIDFLIISVGTYSFSGYQRRIWLFSGYQRRRCFFCWVVSVANHLF